MFTMLVAATAMLFVCTQVLGEDTLSQLTIPMPQPNPPAKHNDYWCVVMKLPATDSYIVKYEPLADPTVAHHMLVYGCRKPYRNSGSWPCPSGETCSDKSRFLFAWAKGADGISMPEGVGFFVGPSSDQYAVLQIHYGKPPVDSSHDAGALTLHLTTTKQPRVAGIFLIVGSESIPPNQQAYTISSGCKFPGPNAIHPFAYRTHAHSLCKQIDGYVVKDGNWQLIGSRSPQDPQAFYQVKNSNLGISEGDWLAARCIYSSVGQSQSVHMGSTSEDEMCNFYMMYDMPNTGQGLSTDYCASPAPNDLTFPAVVPVTPIPDMDSMGAEHHHGNHDSSPENGEYECPKSIPPGIRVCQVVGGATVVHTNNTSPTSWGGDPASTGGLPLKPLPMPTEGLPPKPPLDKDLLHSNTSDVAMATSLPTAILPVATISLLPQWTGDSSSGYPVTVVSVIGPKPSVGLAWAGTLSPADGWPYNDLKKTSEAKFGQISAVAIGANGTVYILHRGGSVWDGSSFSPKYTYNHISDGPISVPTVVGISPTGEVLSSWGEGLFYLPHGLTIDHQGNYWITDVAMHQVFKFSPSMKPLLAKGTQFMPGSGQNYFCQPAAVAVERSGVFYVADGYCNSRVVRFTKDGEWDIAWSDPVGEVPLPIRVAHSLAILEEEKRLFLADRENSRILSYDIVTGEGRVFSDTPAFGGAVFAISFTANGTWPMVAINGHGDINSGFTINNRGAVISTWGPAKQGFSQPHGIAVSPTCEVYVAEIGPNVLWKFLPVLANVTIPASLEPSTEDLPQGSVSANGINDLTTTGSDSSTVEAVSSYSLLLFVAVFGVSAVVIIAMITVICCFSNQQRMVGAGQNAKKAMQTLLKPHHAGFTKLQTYDSASEDEMRAVSKV